MSPLPQATEGLGDTEFYYYPVGEVLYLVQSAVRDNVAAMIAALP